MSQSKMNSYEASCIAKTIAVKAFAHVLDPLDKEVNFYLYGCYCKIMTSERIEHHVQYGMGEYADKITVKVHVPCADNPSGERTYEEAISSDVLDLCKTSRWGPDFVFFTIEETSEYTRLCAKRAPWRTHRDELAKELVRQLSGRSAKQSMKDWPEAADIIADHFGITTHIAMVKPLEVLLSKYLPMLAAPQGE